MSENTIIIPAQYAADEKFAAPYADDDGFKSL